jgi:hypothetical protein
MIWTILYSSRQQKAKVLKIMVEQYEFSGIDLRPEAKLLLYCARTQVEAANVEKVIQLLQKFNLDWGDLIKLTIRHNLAPLFYRSLDAIAPAAIPEPARAEFKKQIQKNVQGNLFLTKELRLLLSRFDQHGIPAIPYKGPVLVSAVYANLSLRPFNDLDVLVHERDVLQAMDLLLSCGYQLIRPRIVAEAGKKLQPLLVGQLIENSPWAYQLVFWNPEGQGVVELHWRITPKYIFPNNPEQLWENLKQVDLGGVTILSFSPENLLWFLCVHATKHQWKRLSWLCDIAELIRAFPHLNWEQVAAQAVRLGVERRLYLGLFLANRLLEAPLPKAIETKIHTTPHVKALAQQVVQRVFEGAEQPVRFPYLERFAFQLKAMDRMVDRGRYLWRFAMLGSQRQLIEHF